MQKSASLASVELISVLWDPGCFSHVTGKSQALTQWYVPSGGHHHFYYPQSITPEHS